MNSADVPLPLRAGPCIETWAFDFGDAPPDDRSEKLWRRQRDDAAVKRFRDARQRWLLSVGIDDGKTENMRPAALLVRQGPARAFAQ